MKTWAYLFGYHGNRYNCYQIWDQQVCPVYINWKKRAFILSFFIFCKEVCYVQCASRKNTLFFVLKIRSLNEWSWNKKEMKELVLADLDVLIWASRSSFFVVILREWFISCACGTLLVSSFFLKLTLTFLISIGQFLSRRHTATEKYKRKIESFNSLFLFLSLSLHLCLENMLSTIRLVFFFLHFKFLSWHSSCPFQVSRDSSPITHGSSLMAHHLWLITHGSSLITHHSCLPLIMTPGFHQDSWLPSWLLSSFMTPGSPPDSWLPSWLLVIVLFNIDLWGNLLFYFLLSGKT